jgi:hypothetical protein
MVTERGGSEPEAGGPVVKPRWSPEINLGHVAQAATVVMMLTGGYVALRSDITSAEHRAAERAAGLSARIAILEAQRQNDEKFQNETRRDLTRLIDALSDLRVLIARKQDIRGDVLRPDDPLPGRP